MNNQGRETYPQIEERILKTWQENKIFEKSLEIRKEAPKYTFYDGPPFATGLPHYGHILSSVAKDLIPRYKTMRGFYVRRRWGWDCHGLPIETLVEKKLNISGKKQIEEIGIGKFNETARGMVLDYISHWKQMVDRIGRWIEFDNSYKTMDTTFMESVWWALKAIWDKGKIYEGKKVLLYCTRCETPVSKAETEMDGGYQTVSGDSITVKFKLLDPQSKGLPAGTSILAWTTTPWTLPGNVALAVGRDIEYILVKRGNEYFVLGKPLLERYTDQGFKAVREVKFSDLIGLKYEPLFEVKAFVKDENSYSVVEGDFVTTEDGTGVVHIAPMYGEDDYKVGQKDKLANIQLLLGNGNYNDEAPEFLRGKHYDEAQHEIIDSLAGRGLLVKQEVHEHSYPFCWRCGSPLIYNALSAWFIDIQSIKDRLIELNEKINWYPEFIKEGRFLYILQNAPDWNISRNRYWATALPFWKCEKCGKSVCAGSIDELREKSKNFKEVYGDKKTEEIDLHRPYIDEIIIECPDCRAEARRIPEVIDCWVESSSMPFAELHYPFENEQLFEDRLPAQFIAEYIGQTRAWFYYLHVLAATLFDDISFENVVVTGNILAEDGSKMSKSKGNFPDPNLMIDKYGADCLRYYLMSSVVMQADNLFFSERDLRDIYNKVVNISYNVNNYYEMYAVNSSDTGFGLDNLLDRWIISKLNRFVANTTKYLESYNTAAYCREIRDFIDELSTWWLRRSRDRFKDEGEDGKNARAVLRYALRNYALAIAPVMPYLAENVWQGVKSEEDPSSVHLADWPAFDEKLIDDELEKQMDAIRSIVEIGHSLRAENGIKVRQPLAKIAAAGLKIQDELKNILLSELNVKEFVEKLEEDGLVENEIKGLRVILDTKLTDELREEGLFREIVRHIQDLRKNAGCVAGDMAKIQAESEEIAIIELIRGKSAEILKETKTKVVWDGKSFDLEKEIRINGNTVILKIKKGSED